MMIAEHCNNISNDRAVFLLGRAMSYIGEYDCRQDLYDTFHEIIGMTDNEIKEMGFSSLSEYFREKLEPCEEQGDDNQVLTM